ncbi:MAG TPA: glycoside hydrolase family 43 protein [Thermoleophilaceae bacterium]|nr:glycoside hydrolase family 43 protein [Thermoleophilaceae bacterium]
MVLRAYISRTLVGAAAVLPVPVVAGDVPDPSAIYDNGQHVAVVTANGWAPSFRMYTSPDRSKWTLRGQVFKNPPKWVAVNMWAPEITKLSADRYAVYYSARSRRGQDPWFCIGAAFSKSATGPYKDLGKPIRCGEEGSIDPYVLRDENGRRTLIFKNDGNEFQRPTSIWAQPMSEDGTSVSGRAKVIMRNDARWEGGVIEGPSIVRSGGYFHMLYSGGLFGGTVGCDYALGTARSRTLTGEWEKFPGNPILKGGNGWSCPGHGSIYFGPGSSLDALYHAYPQGTGRIAGRQMIADTAYFSPDRWLKIGNGVPPPRSPGADVLAFTDRFRGRLNANWEWPFMRKPGIRTGNGVRITASRLGRDRFDAGVIARRTAGQNYTATAVLDKGGLRGKARGGIASYRSEFEGIGLSVGREEMTVWQRNRGKLRILARGRAPGGRSVTLRMRARGNTFRFQANGRTVGRTFRGPIYESARMALTAGGVRRGSAVFRAASVSAN